MQNLTLKNYDIKIGDGEKLLVMAGLNVLEDEGLALEVAAELKNICADLELPYIFKASWDKANRSSINSYRGVGLEAGLPILAAVKAAHQVPILTDLHEPQQAEKLGAVADVLQLPAFLVRQTDLVVATARQVAATGGWLHAKKSQNMAAWDCANIIAKARESAPDVQIILCERGTSFGYNNLVVDMLAIPEMKKLGVPVTIDATHAVQLPGADPRTKGASSGGRREGVAVLAKAGVAAGANGVFLEFHPEPDNALCDAPSCLALSQARDLLAMLKKLHEVS